MWPFFLRERELTALGVTVFLWLVCATSSAPKNEFVSAEGVVVAIQGGKTDTRLIEPASFADLAEIYLVRVDRWSQSRKEKYVLVEYIHHADLIRYDEFDKAHWNFEIHQASPEETRDCLSWMAREGSFHHTAFGAKIKLPDPKLLTCFLMEKRPSVVRESVPPPTPESPNRRSQFKWTVSLFTGHLGEEPPKLLDGLFSLGLSSARSFRNYWAALC